MPMFQSRNNSDLPGRCFLLNSFRSSINTPIKKRPACMRLPPFARTALTLRLPDIASSRNPHFAERPIKAGGSAPTRGFPRARLPDGMTATWPEDA